MSEGMLGIPVSVSDDLVTYPHGIWVLEQVLRIK